MSITNLEAALLSFDAYNRGYNSAFSNNGTRQDDDGLGESGFIGDAEVILAIGDVPQAFAQRAEAAGFYAVAYELNGQTVISYRGTDSLGELLTTDPNIFIGDNFTNVQFSLAVEFYNSVRAARPDSNIVLTGHSLGGALAGYVSTLFREEANDNFTDEGEVAA